MCSFGPETFLSSQDSLVARNFLLGKHGAAATRGPAMAGGVFPRLSIVDVVIVGQLLARLNVAQGNDPDATFDLIGFTVGLAGMINECSHAKTVDDGFAAVHAE